MNKNEETRIKSMPESELFIAIASPVGTDSAVVYEALDEILKNYNYETFKVKISNDLLMPKLAEYTNMDITKERLNKLMDKGNELREKSTDNSVLARGAISIIRKLRNEQAEKNENELKGKRYAYIIDSLKHKDEVKKLREVYSTAFYLFAINESEKDRVQYLVDMKNMGKHDAINLIKRDQDERFTWGQHTRDVFELADFHISINIDSKRREMWSYSIERTNILTQVKNQISRIIELMFGCPYHTPTFEEYAMFMAYATALRSGDLSRQVGAVIANDKQEILAMGANEVPKYGGGQYWASIDYCGNRGWNAENGRDMMLKRKDVGNIIGYDPNKTEIKKLISEIVEDTEHFNYDEVQLRDESLNDYKNKFSLQIYDKLKSLTEFGRTVHAEMAAMLSCARLGISLQDTTLFCSTFPCHNCARHAIYCGIKRIIYIEPYPKSKALELHSDSTSIDKNDDKVVFEPFIGVGPRCFFDLFSMKLSSGYDIIRKDDKENVIVWKADTALLRCSTSPLHYIDQEIMEAFEYTNTIKSLEE